MKSQTKKKNIGERLYSEDRKLYQLQIEDNEMLSIQWGDYEFQKYSSFKKEENFTRG